MADDQIQGAMKNVAKMVTDFKTDLDSLRKSVDMDVADVRKKMEEMSTLQSGLEVTDKRIIKLVTTLSSAWSILALTEPPDQDARERVRIAARRRHALEGLAEIAEWMPTNRLIAIYRGRLYVSLGDFDGAINVLNSVLIKRAEKGLDKDNDQADLLYNKACYLNRKADLETQPAMKENLRTEAWQAIRQSIRLRPENLQEALNDSDFNGLAEGGRDWTSLS